MSAGFVSAVYIAASILFILALGVLIFSSLMLASG